MRLFSTDFYHPRVNDNGKSFDTAVSILTIDELPNEYMLWQNIDNASNIDSPEQSIPCNHIISVTYKVVESSTAQNKANRKASSLDKKAKIKNIGNEIQYFFSSF